MLAQLQRTAFVTDRTLEFFTESELTTQMGYGRPLWPLVLVKELIDNAVDACETGDIAPEISIVLEPDSITVADNGPGIPAEVIEKSLDYHIRVSDKKHYVSPTRGQLGNALKCVWAVPFVADGEHGLVEVETSGLHHRIEVRLDRIAQKPNISHTTEASVNSGTSVKIHWPHVASYSSRRYQDFYQCESLNESLTNLIADFAAFNPHASLSFDGKHFPASNPAWRKWRTDHPTSAHWYRPADLRALIAAYINEGDRPTRDFIAEFAGLSGTQVRKRVLTEAGITASRLSDMVVAGDVDMSMVERLLDVMRRNSKPVEPSRLGIVGRQHLESAMKRRGDVGGFEYHKAVQIDDEGLPCVLEIAFGMKTEGSRDLILGTNWSTVFKIPSGAIANALNNCRVQTHDPVILLIHQARPRFAFTDHGKGAIAE
jgi:DNA topoisomerase VI subunit B